MSRFKTVKYQDKEKGNTMRLITTFTLKEVRSTISEVESKLAELKRMEREVVSHSKSVRKILEDLEWVEEENIEWLELICRRLRNQGCTLEKGFRTSETSISIPARLNRKRALLIVDESTKSYSLVPCSVKDLNLWQSVMANM